MSDNSSTPQNKTFSDLIGISSTDIKKYYEIFGDNPVFTSVKPRDKAGFKGWNNPDKLLTPKEAQFLVNRNRNIGLSLGLETEKGYTVCFDKESHGEVPASVIERIEEYAVFSWSSQSGGYNHLLTVTEEAYEYLSQFKTKVWFSEEGKHDLELLTTGHALVPPSKIDENHQYDNLKIDPQDPTVDSATIKEILSDIPISKKDEGDKSQTTQNGEEGKNSGATHQKLPSDFNVNRYFSENIPGTDSYLERLNTMLQNPEVAELWYENYQDRSKAELQLRSYIAWYFNADSTIVQYIFEEELPNWRDSQLKYQENKHHAKDVVNNAGKYINRPYYTTGISFNLREQLASQIFQRETVTVNGLYGNLLRTDEIKQYEKTTILKALRIFTKLDLIERVSNTKYQNKRIDEEYINKLEDLNKEYKPTKLLVDYE